MSALLFFLCNSLDILAALLHRLAEQKVFFKMEKNPNVFLSNILIRQIEHRLYMHNVSLLYKKAYFGHLRASTPGGPSENMIVPG